ncbi:MAG: cyclodeaminase/cyclohydrolase family protein [Candidatus Marinimicrobia bacterium]|nr:cyclodeaminase/cyclohydrolase family protein [Candidatus Neomarinimicrobiota bacterium]
MKKEVKDQTIDFFLNDLSSKNPAPGGGSVSALAGALSASLVCMVCNVTIGKKGYEEQSDELKQLLLKAKYFRRRFLQLAEDDKNAFLEVVKSKNSVEGLKKAIFVPSEVARLADDLLALTKKVEKIGNKNANSDARIAMDLVRVAFKGATLNVLANLQLTDIDLKKEI